MSKKNPRSTKDLYKLLQDQPGIFFLVNGDTVMGTVLNVDKDLGDLLIEKDDGNLVLIPEQSLSYIETPMPHRKGEAHEDQLETMEELEPEPTADQPPASEA